MQPGHRVTCDVWHYRLNGVINVAAWRRLRTEDYPAPCLYIICPDHRPWTLHPGGWGGHLQQPNTTYPIIQTWLRKVSSKYGIYPQDILCCSDADAHYDVSYFHHHLYHSHSPAGPSHNTEGNPGETGHVVVTLFFQWSAQSVWLCVILISYINLIVR